ncbi:hypothetical protein [Paraburkholderia tropica]|uniref:hypothetical protein n=1 Tax=Paraburkholderia tropica TaxID=92647 RepID=UPI002AB72B95|nr:hypothetical protein [Paraburkholderia tropica]
MFERNVKVEHLDERVFFNALGPEFRSVTIFASVVGSVAEGLATTTSDTDIFLVVEDEAVCRLSSMRLRALEVGGRLIDVVLLGRKEVEDLLGTSADKWKFLDLRKLEFVHKIIFGCVFFGLPGFRVLTEKFSIEDFLYGMRDRYLRNANDEFSNLVGYLDDNLLLSAADTARTYVRSCLDAYLSTLGDCYPQPKWRIQRLLRNIDRTAPVVDEVLRVEFDAPYRDEVLLKGWIESCLRTARKFQLGVFFGEGAFSAFEKNSSNSTLDHFFPDRFVVERIDGLFVVRVGKSHGGIDSRTAAILLSLAWPIDNETRAGILKSELGMEISADGISLRHQSFIKSKIVKKIASDQFA